MDDDTDKIRICNTWEFGCNRCFICDCKYKHSTVITKYEDGLEEVELRFIHPRCAKSAQRLQKMKGKLLDAEFEHFCLKFNKYFNDTI